MRESQVQEYGPYLLACAIRLYPTSSEVLDILLSHNLGDINTYPPQSQTRGPPSRPRFPPIPPIPPRQAVPSLNQHTPLGYAIRGMPARHELGYCNVQLVGRILDVFGNANSITTFSFNGGGSQTALLDAIETKSGEMVRLLLRHGAEVNEPARFSLKRTPLQKAVELGSLDIIRLLLSKGADVNAPPAARGGGTALQFAAIGGNCTIAKLLIDHGAQFDIPPSPYGHGRWPLEGAAENGRIDMIQFLWNANRGQFDDRQCDRAKRYAEYYGHNACRDLIDALMAARQAMFQPQAIEDIDVYIIS
ncbi:hypothetical protein ABKA04_003714 [Annulohypoxylon sp. FPYF3050]